MLGATDYGIGPGTVPGALLFRYPIPHVGADKSGQDYSELGVWDNPGYAGPFTGKVVGSLVSKDVTDTASLSATEGPIDTNEIATYDSANLTATELATLLNFYGVSDTANVRVNEAIALNITGVTSQAVTDTASLTLTESVAVGVTIDVTDTASLTLSGETSSVAISTEVLAATDTASIAANDFATLTVFAGNATFDVSDNIFLQAMESASAVPVIDTEVVAIKFLAKVPTIRFRKL